MYIYLTNSGGSSITEYNSAGEVVGTATFNANFYPELKAFMLDVEANIGSSSIYISEHDGTIINLEVTTGRNPDAVDMAIYTEVTNLALSDIDLIQSLL